MAAAAVCVFVGRVVGVPGEGGVLAGIGVLVKKFKISRQFMVSWEFEILCKVQADPNTRYRPKIFLNVYMYTGRAKYISFFISSHASCKNGLRKPAV